MVVHNRTRQKAEPLLAAGALWAESPAAAAKQVKIVITMLSDPEAVSETALAGKNALLAGLARRLALDRLQHRKPLLLAQHGRGGEERKVRFLDAPVAGSKMPAEQGQLLFFVGGNKADVDEARPLLEAMGKAVHHMGGHGMRHGA